MVSKYVCSYFPAIYTETVWIFVYISTLLKLIHGSQVVGCTG